MSDSPKMFDGIGRTSARATLQGSVPGDVPRRTLLVAAAVAVVVGTTYALSPLTIWFVVISTGIVAGAVRGLSERERQWVLGVLSAAIILRVLAIILLFLTRDPEDQYRVSFFFDGDGAALKLRSMWIQSFWSGEQIDPLEARGGFVRYGWTSYLYVLAYLQYVFGPATYGIHLFNIVLFLAGSVLLYRLVRVAYGRLTAFLGLVLLMFLPTWFLWSVSALKEVLQFFLMAVVVVSACVALRDTSWWRSAVIASVSVVSILAVSTVRDGLGALAVATVTLGAASAFIARRRYLLIACPIVLVVASGYLLRQDMVQERLMSEAFSAANFHLGHVNTDGHAFKTLDQRFYTGDDSTALLNTMTSPEAIRFALRSLVSVMIVPLPWDMVSTSELLFLPAQIIWYGLWLFACGGLLAGFRRHALLTSSIVVYSVIAIVAVATNTGNVGTLIRHRDMVLPFIVWLVSLGGVSMLVRVAGLHTKYAVSGGLASSVPEAGPMFAATRSSLVMQWIRCITNESRLCRVLIYFSQLLTRRCQAALEFLTRRNRVDTGIPHDEETFAIRHLASLVTLSRPGVQMGRWLVSCRAGWDRATAVGLMRRHFAGLFVQHRVRVLGLVLVVAVFVEALVSSIGGTGASLFAWNVRIICLVFGGISIVACQPVAIAWENWQGRSLSTQIDEFSMRVTRSLPN